MSTLGVLGALAQGYTDAAKQRREQNLALGEHQRDLQISLLDKLLADPSTPEEYKGTLLQQRIATTNANQYDKNGQLKLPSLDDMRQQLPPVQRPATPGPGPAPAIQLPSIPPTPLGGPLSGQSIPSAIPLGSPLTPSNAPALPALALPPSGVQNAPGGPSVPPMLQMPTAPPTLPSVPIATPQPPPIAEAGQFHPLSHEEQVQREVARAVAHRDALIAQGIPPQQASVAAGLTVPPTLHNVLPGSGVIDQFGHVVIAPGTKPVGPPVRVANEDGTFSLVQGYLAPDGSKVFKPVETPEGTSVIPPTPMLPTVRTSTTSDEFGTKSTTTSKSQKVLPTAGGGKTTAPAKPATPATSPAAANDGLTPAERRAAFQNAQIAQKAAQNDAIKAAGAARTMVNLLDTQTEYMDGIAKGEAPTPRQDLSLIVAAVRAMNPGSVRLPQKELDLELRAGSFGDRFRRYWMTASQGVLPDDQRKDLFSIVQKETATTARSAAQNWQQVMPKQQLPAHLKRFAVQTPNAPPSNLPDAALKQLSEGHITTFANGQKWTLQNGNPVQVGGTQ